MSTEPADDLMAIADAAGVTAPEGIDPRLQPLLTDDVLASVVASWNQAAAGQSPLDDDGWRRLGLCPRCGSTGLVDDALGRSITCPACGGES